MSYSCGCLRPGLEIAAAMESICSLGASDNRNCKMGRAIMACAQERHYPKLPFQACAIRHPDSRKLLVAPEISKGNDSRSSLSWNLRPPNDPPVSAKACFMSGWRSSRDKSSGYWREVAVSWLIATTGRVWGKWSSARRSQYVQYPLGISWSIPNASTSHH